MPTILDRITATKWREIAAARAVIPPAELERRIADLPAPRNFRAALHSAPITVIAEVKKASPSAGVIRADFDAGRNRANVRIARRISGQRANGCRILSGQLDIPERGEERSRHSGVAERLHPRPLPTTRSAGRRRGRGVAHRRVLARRHAAGRSSARRSRWGCTHSWNCTTRSSCRECSTAARPLSASTTATCGRSRTRLEHTLELLPRIPADRTVVSESGIKTHADLQNLAAAGRAGRARRRIAYACGRHRCGPRRAFASPNSVRKCQFEHRASALDGALEPPPRPANDTPVSFNSCACGRGPSTIASSKPQGADSG